MSSNYERPTVMPDTYIRIKKFKHVSFSLQFTKKFH